MPKDFRKWHERKSAVDTMDARRLAYRAGEVAPQDFTKIIEKLKALLP